jgi:hypothetical protein
MAKKVKPMIGVVVTGKLKRKLENYQHKHLVELGPLLSRPTSLSEFCALMLEFAVDCEADSALIERLGRTLTEQQISTASQALATAKANQPARRPGKRRAS